MVCGDPSTPKGDLFRACHLQALPTLDRADELPGQRVVRPGVEPRVAAAKDLHRKPPLVKVEAVQICDLQLAARGWTQPPSGLDHGQIVEAKPRNRVVQLWLLRLLLQANGFPSCVKFDDAKFLWVIHVVREDHGARRPFCRLVERLR